MIKKGTLLSILFITSLIVCLSSCTYNKVTGCSSTTAVTYNNTINAYMTSNCTNCHCTTNASKNIDLSTYDGVKSAYAKGNFMNSMNTGSMPQNGSKLPYCTLQTIQAWIDAGMAQ